MENVNVLFIDDNEGDLVYLEAIIELDNLPINGRYISDSDEAIALLNSLPAAEFPEIIIVDYNMPRITGFEMIENFYNSRKDLARFPDVYINSTSIRIADKNKINSYPYIKSYLEKPVASVILQQLVLEIQHQKV